MDRTHSALQSPVVSHRSGIVAFSRQYPSDYGQKVDAAEVVSESPLKRLFDLVSASVLLFFSGPVMLACMLMVKLTSVGPAIYKQTRLGRGRRPFTIFKIRTMTNNSEALTGARWATVNDPRVTTFGKFLRTSHLDELPQLWNIIRGDMSLVGPRPERPEFMGKLEAAIDHYGERMLVRPGVTGLAQVNLPPDVDLESVRRKLVYDRYYVANGTLWLDLRLLIVTGMYILGVPFRVSCAAWQLPVCGDALDTVITSQGGCCAVGEAPVAAK